MQIIPAVLEKNPTFLFSQIKRLLPYFKTFQIDIADGKSVPNRTVQIEEISEFLPHYNLQTTNYKLSFDFHLMVKDYEAEVKKLANLTNWLKIKNVFVHFSLLPNIQYLISNFPFSLDLVLNPEDRVDKLTSKYQISAISAIQIMSVDPGFQGSAFIPETLKKIDQLRLKDYRNRIYLDGSINQDTLPIISSLKYKPDYLCVGSFLSKAENIKERVNYLDSLNL